jgi:nitric oxide dioxygenase
MILNLHEIVLIQESFGQIAGITDHAAALFYARLFELDPSLRPLFRGDIQEQGRKLMAMLSTAVAALERLDGLTPTLRQLGVRHADYGVREEHYSTVGTALLWTLEKGLGPDFTAEVRAAWIAVYTFLADTMIEAARQARAAAA